MVMVKLLVASHFCMMKQHRSNLPRRADNVLPRTEMRCNNRIQIEFHFSRIPTPGIPRRDALLKRQHQANPLSDCIIRQTTTTTVNGSQPTPNYNDISLEQQ
jgi:hypothetical protein